jgi:uncharacterized protein (TIGR00255 family)
MIKSMTGFGRGEAADANCRLQVDLRGVNHRYLDLQVRIPRSLMPLEMELRDWIKKAFRRGRMEVSVQFERLGHDVGKIRVDNGLALAYQTKLNALAAHLELDTAVPFDLILRQPGVLELGEDGEDLDTVRDVLREAFGNAAAGAEGMRAAEGAKLAIDLMGCVKALRELREELVEVVPKVQEEITNRFKEKIKVAAGELGLDESRLHQEAAVLLSKLDVNEEVVRLASHLDQVEELLGSDDSVGRRLDFLAQEMHREITTLGNKVQGLEISRRVQDAKAEIEKFREQVQNVE